MTMLGGMFVRDTHSPFASEPYGPRDEPVTRGRASQPVITQHARRISPVDDTPVRMPKQVKIILGMIAFALFAIGCFAGAQMMPRNHQPAVRHSLPACEDVDGLNQRACIEYGDGATLVNLQNGHYTYDVENNTLTAHK